MRKYHYSLFVLMVVALVSYQNCGDVKLTPPPPILPSVEFDGLKGKFCASLTTGHRYTIEKFMIINLTSRVVVSNSYMGIEPGYIGLYPDSDMDGLVDAEEVSQGFDPLHARTTGRLDSLCRDEGNCGTCSDQGLVGFGLYACETNSIDTDGDGLIDFIELIRGTDRIRADTHLDDDNDLLSNYEEIMVGRSPVHAQDSLLSSKQLMVYDYAPSSADSSDCPMINALQRQATYDFQVSNIPLVETMAYVDPTPGAFNLSHEQNENVILILFTSAPLDPSLEKEYYAKVVKVAANIEGLSISLQPTDFTKLGH